jgi:hypothetical protein
MTGRKNFVADASVLTHAAGLVGPSGNPLESLRYLDVIAGIAINNAL